MIKIDITKPLHFYDIKEKSDCFLKSINIVFSDNEICVCEALILEKEDIEKEQVYQNLVENPERFKIVFDIQTCEVWTPDFVFWLAIND